MAATSADSAGRPGSSGSPGRPGAPGRRPVGTLLVVFAIVALEFSLSFWLASYLSESVGLDERLAVGMVSGLYVANLIGRVLASRLARRIRTETLLASAILLALAGLPFLLTATDVSVAALGLVLVGAGIGAMFPLTSALHVAASPGTADVAIGEVLAVAAVGQLCGPVLVSAVAEGFGLRIGLLCLVGFALIAGAGLRWHASGDGSDRSVRTNQGAAR